MNNLRLYVKESIDELLYKVTWPTWQELQSTTLIVLVSLVLFSVGVFLVDFLLGANPENPLFKGILYYVYSIFS
ncbi:MAG: preprotein translocase subunit SecE [Sphingobacteriales bacterium]|nr:preprotein translocase subunit SecE [Sphingobacteriales bacterium]MCC7223262.1 preprotein translocase subunit SecE [Chitinophagales bacterium]